jgi:hypothetical protein
MKKVRFVPLPLPLPNCLPKGAYILMRHIYIIIRFMVGRISTLNFRVCNYKIWILHFLNQTYIAHHNFKRFHISSLDNHTCGPENST